MLCDINNIGLVSQEHLGSSYSSLGGLATRESVPKNEANVLGLSLIHLQWVDTIQASQWFWAEPTVKKHSNAFNNINRLENLY